MARYRLDDLGWYQFEWMCQSLLKATLGLSVEAWGGYSDLGRDAYSTLPLRLERDHGEIPGPTVFQAKFVEGANGAGAKSWSNLRKAVAGEIAMISERVRKRSIKMPTNLVVLTNAPISAANREDLIQLIGATFPEMSAFIWGAEDLCAMLDDAPNIRVSFPQLLSLRDFQELLASVVDREIVTRSSLAISKARELSPVFVPTRSYNRTLSVLNQHNFAVLTGPPEVGKTTIARLVGLAKLGEGWECRECKSPDDILRGHSFENPQIFIADDAFGTTDFQPEIAHKWGTNLDDVIRLLDSRHWLVWTSRPAPLHAALARMHLQGRAENFPKPGEVLVDAAKLSKNERALILYRHAKHAQLDEAAKILVKSHASLVVTNAHFTPERASRFVRKELPELVRVGASENEIKAAIIAAIEQPTISMKKSFEALSDEHQWVLISMLDASSGSVTRKALLLVIERHCERAAKESFIDDLSSHFLRSSEEDGSEIPLFLQNEVRWMHPSWRDLVIDQLSNDPARRRAFLANCALPGFKLALSVAGGASGGRRKPLLRDAEDWEALNKSLPRLITTDDWNHFSLLTSVEIALASEKIIDDASPLGRIARSVLDLLRDAWDMGKSSPEPDTLQAYYQVSEYLNPLPHGPHLSELWRDSFERAETDLEAFDEWTTSFELSGFLHWLNLIRVIMRNEPRFLRQREFPEKYQAMAEETLCKMKSRIGLKPDLETEEDCSEEESRFTSIQEIAEKIGGLFEELAKDSQEVADRAEEGEIGARHFRSDLEDAAKKAEEEREYPIPTSLQPPSAPFREIATFEQPLNIDHLFRDL